MLDNLNVSETGFLFDTLSGSTYTVNDSGRYIIECLQKGLSVKEIVEKIHEDFENGDGTHIDLDVSDFIFQMKSFGLVKRIKS